jgi:hypothetical protein
MFIGYSLLIGCTKAGCDDCLYQKQEFCNTMAQVNCNSAYLTDNIDQLTRSCGKDDANSFISATTKSCTHDSLTCPKCE